jgi:hypothetical protein
MIMRIRCEESASMPFSHILRHSARSLVVVTLSLAGLITPALAAPAAAPSPSPTACATVPPALTDDFDATFSYELTSTAVQHFVALLGSASPKAQADVVASASAAARSPQRAQVRAAFANVCPNPSEAIGFARSVAVISHVWSVPELQNDKSAADLTDVLQTAVSALAHPDALTAEQRSAAAAPFQALESAVPAPSPTATDPCANRFSPAQPVRLVPLAYPVFAIAARATGTIFIKVSLSETGGVRSATLYRKTMGEGGASDALVESAIISAAATTYQPDIEKCVPSAGTYLFKAEFALRR